MGESKTRKIITLGIMLLFLGMTISSTTGLYLDKQSIKPLSSGNILYVGGNGTGNYSKIQDAIDNASDGDIVYVFSGTYYENVNVNKRINLVGENKYTTVIDAGGIEDAVYVYPVDRTTVTGFTLRNSGSNNQNPDCGIEVRTDYNFVTGNLVKNNYMGISLRSAYDNTVSNNIVTNNNKHGIGIGHYTENNYVVGNIVSNNGEDGICLVGDRNNYRNNVSGNTITYNHNGIYLGGASEIFIFGNNIRNNLYNGIWLSQSHNNIVSWNNIENHDDGIEMEDSSNNSICCNNFINNERNAYFAWGYYNSWWDGNYWDELRFFIKPIVGLRRFKIGGSFEFDFLWICIDWHPAKKPYDIGV